MDLAQSELLGSRGGSTKHRYRPGTSLYTQLAIRRMDVGSDKALLDRLDQEKRWSELNSIFRDIEIAEDNNDDNDEDDCLAEHNFDDVSELDMNSMLNNKIGGNRSKSTYDKRDFNSFATLLPTGDAHDLSKLQKSFSASNVSGCDLQDFENLLKKDDGECIRRLVNKLHEQSSDLRSTELQFNHSKLQVQALLSSQQQLQAERDELTHALAVSEQDLLLLETKLQDVVSFESNGSGSPAQLQKGLLIEDIRGRLLSAADNRIAELTESLREVDNRHTSSEQKALNEKVKLASDNASLKSELRRLSDQLAQRAVLSAAQERRWNETARIHESHTAEKTGELIDLRARLQQLESTHERADRERIDAVLQCRQLAEEQRRLESMHADLTEKLSASDAEVVDLTAQNLSLQTTVDRLRSSDLEGLERELAAEVEAIREEARSRELALSRQLEEARDLLSHHAEERERLLDGMGVLRADLESKNSLLRQISQNGFIAPADTQIGLSSQEVFHQFIDPLDESALSEDQLRFDSSVNEHVSMGPADNSHFAAMFDDSANASVQQRRSPPPPLRASNNDRYHQSQDDEDDGKQDESFDSDAGRSANLGYLIGEEQHTASTLAADDSSRAVFLSVDESVMESAALRSRVAALEARERELAELNSAQMRQLGELSKLLDSHRSSLGAGAAAEKDRAIKMLSDEVHALGEQLSAYREELRLVEEQAERNKQLGFYEASEAGKVRATALEASLLAMEERCRTLQFLSDGRAQAASKLEETIVLLREELHQLRESSSRGNSSKEQELAAALAAALELEAGLSAAKAEALLLREGRRADELRLEREVIELSTELSDLRLRHEGDVALLAEAVSRQEQLTQQLESERDSARDVLAKAEAEHRQELAAAAEYHSKERQRAEADALEERSRLVATHDKLREAVQQHWQQELESTVRLMSDASAGEGAATTARSCRDWDAELARLQQEHSEEVALLQHFYEEELERLQLSVRESSESRAVHSEEQVGVYRRKVLELTVLNEEQQQRLQEQEKLQHHVDSLEGQVRLLTKQLSAAVSAQSSFDPSGAAASALQQVEEDHLQELESVREHLRRVYEEELREQTEVMQATNDARLVDYRKGVVGRYKMALMKQQEQFSREKQELEDQFRRECQQIFREAQDLVRQASGGVRRSSSVGRTAVSPAPELERTGKRAAPESLKAKTEFTIYPEMLSPEVTNALFKKIAHRSLTEEETRNIFAAPASPLRVPAATVFAGGDSNRSGVRVSVDKDGKLQLSHSVINPEYNTLPRFKGQLLDKRGVGSFLDGQDEDDSVESIDFHDAADPLPIARKATSGSPARSGITALREASKYRKVTP